MPSFFDTLPLTAKLPLYRSFHAFGWPQLLPVNITVSVTYTCPSRCKTCDIWQKKVDDLKPSEYEKIFTSLANVPTWVTVSGGDQFIRSDLPEIFGLIRNILRPKIINLPMNGILTKQIEKQLPDIMKNTRGSKLILNLSLDEVGERHDEMRGHKGNWEKTMHLYKFARELQKENPHVTIGIHTVISRFNVDRFKEIYGELIQLGPDSYITEIAENRVELKTMLKEISPAPDKYAGAIDFLTGEMRKHRRPKFMGRLVESFRLEYYELVKQVLARQEQVIPCYAGWASAQIAPDGNIWGCCIRAESVGNLRDYNYDFAKAWFSKEADQFRHSVYKKECHCPLANASYTNLLLSVSSLAKVTKNLLLN